MLSLCFPPASTPLCFYPRRCRGAPGGCRGAPSRPFPEGNGRNEGRLQRTVSSHEHGRSRGCLRPLAALRFPAAGVALGPILLGRGYSGWADAILTEQCGEVCSCGSELWGLSLRGGS